MNYLIEICVNIRHSFPFLAALDGTALAVFMLIFMISTDYLFNDYGDEEESKNKTKNMFKNAFITLVCLSVILFVLHILVPTEEFLVKLRGY